MMASAGKKTQKILILIEDGSFRLGDDVSELARADGEHVVLVKLTYWLGL